MTEEHKPIPELRELVGGKYAAVCVGCVRPSFPVPATSPADAWRELQRHGWQSLAATASSRAGPRCPQCAGRPEADGAKAVWRPRRKR
jgi:hypothetical protein